MTYYSDKDFKLFKGDCLDILKTIDTNSIDMIFADPPYNLSNDGFTCQSGKMVSVNKGKWDVSKGIENDFEFNKTWLLECQRVLKSTGSIWVSGTYHSIYSCGFAMQLLGFHILNDIIWFKPNASPNLSGRFFTASHESIIWARKDKKAKHTFNYNLMKEINDSDDFLKNPGKQMRSVWAMTVGSKKEKLFGKHPTQKPEKLLSRIISASTNEGDLILDVFNGSGTTGIIATKLGRKYLGIDINESFLDITIKRYQNLKVNSNTLF